jgi:ribonuclease HIII
MNYVFTVKKPDLELFIEHYGIQPMIPEDSRILMVIKTEDLVLTVYQTLKVVLQGSNALDDYLMWSEILGFNPTTDEQKIEVTPQEKPTSKLYNSSAIGSDEVGTGDFFGPVVIATAFVDKKQIPALEALRIRDSKQMSDDYILQIGEKLKSMLLHIVLVTDNPKYNEMTAKGFNLNKIKAYLHNHAIKKCINLVKEPYEYVILDQFCSPQLYFEYLIEVDTFKNITFLQKAESAHLSVAAASIIARFTFLQKMEELNHLAGMKLPLGAGPGVDAIGQIVVLKKGLNFLPQIAKMNFKNLDRIKLIVHK